MSDAYFKRMVDNYAPYIRKVKNDDAAFERALFLFAKEIERDTRHRAAELAGALQRDIQNLRHPEN